MNIANGCCGSTKLGPGEAADTRLEEAMAAAALIGATFHPSLVNDMEILYDTPTVARLAAVMRQVAPEILLAHAPGDYMEDHEAACRLAVTAAFAREMPNFRTDPLLPTIDRSGDDLSCPAAWQSHSAVRARPAPSVCRHHRRHRPENGDARLHRSQLEWLDATQGASLRRRQCGL